MGRITGVTTSTAKRLIMDSGAIYLNYGLQTERLLGATEGGATFTIEQEIREPEIDGLPGPLAGTRRVTAVHARISARLLEQTTDNIVLEIAGSTADSDAVAGYDVIKRTGYVIPESAHVTNVAIVGQVSGTNNPIVCMIHNAIADGEIEFGMEDDNEAGPTVQFTGHFTAAALDAEPWEIRNPKAGFFLTYTAGDNGTIVGDAEQFVESGESGTEVTATPEDGFVFVTWSDGVLTAARTDTNVTADISVTATFEVE